MYYLIRLIEFFLKGPRRIFTTKPVSKKEGSHTVHVGRVGRRAWLYVEHLGNVTGRSPGSLVHLDVMPLLYLGAQRFDF